MQLYIGNKNYSSWSLRPWLLMTQLGLPFEEVRLRLDWDADSDFKKTLLQLAPTGRVPLLVDGDLAVWDTLAIVEYLAEAHPDRGVWPRERKARARARSLCAEMHSGFSALRNRFPMNIEASLIDEGPKAVQDAADVAADVQRIESMWAGQIAISGGPWLFGEFSAADAYFAPVCSRLRTYGVPVSAETSSYIDRVFGTAAMQSWCAAARSEHDFIEADEPYRVRPR
ncbi:MAG: glutathione S-transferase family protein [Caldimonas sp.]